MNFCIFLNGYAEAALIGRLILEYSDDVFRFLISREEFFLKFVVVIVFNEEGTIMINVVDHSLFSLDQHRLFSSLH